MGLEILLLEENFSTRYNKKNVKDKLEANGDVSCMLGKTGLGGKKPEWETWKKDRNLEMGD